MLTQCPDCRKTYLVTKKLKRGKKAQIFCTDCKKKFLVSTLFAEKTTALLTEAKAEYIPKPVSIQKSSLKIKSSDWMHRWRNKNRPIETAINSALPVTDQERLPWEMEKRQFNVNWFVGVVVGFLLLVGQAVFFEGDNLSQNPAYRPHLEQLCRWLGCQLADYENLAELVVLQGSFSSAADNAIVFKAVINNQSAFRQRLPNIKMTLLDYNDQLFAQRVFMPTEYLASSAYSNYSIEPDESIEASLTIAATKTLVGGYNFDLIY